MKIKKKQKVLIAAGVGLGVVLLGGFLGFKLIPSCPVEAEIRTVRGNSLEPLVASGAQIKALFGYYDCHEVKRSDLVLYHYSGDKVPLLKIVKAVPGDRFQLVAKDNGGWYLYVNGRAAVNSKGAPYEFSGKQYQMLSLYAKDYREAVPANTYLLLGNQVNGSVDSSVFGLIDKANILGKAVLN